MPAFDTTPPPGLDEQSRAVLQDLIGWLKQAGYAFVTPTPATHARVVARNDGAGGLADAFGWNRTFDGGAVDAALLQRLVACGLVWEEGDRFRSRIRVSALHGGLFAHSAYPTQDKDAVFLGPDSYRFADLIQRELARCPRGEGAHLVDIGAGAGVGAIVASRCCPDLAITMTDINPKAIAFARINARAAGVAADFVLADTLAPVEGALDIVLANPPYIIDEDKRDYRDGGGMHGAAVAFGMAQDATARLAPQGRFILYTGSAILDGADPLRGRLAELATERGCTLHYREIDPDVFGEELDNAAYADVDRIALVSAVMERRA
ncbi:class I SAM-dependent methyltransferase [uncultured Sphingomonas sp.]|uniref:class I SAM-dependent methyltransferase n=1 Tax=uncultured Sphingomonas sp. TaxID=158754 RepID=UPI0025F1D43C|nr:class I SAM-dependent methyltransferase [uncultured Sphingomonas sp.]